MKSIRILKFRRRYVVVLLAFLGIFLFARSRMGRQETLTYIRPELQSIESIIEVSGDLHASRVATLKFLGGGRLTYLPIQEGSRVSKYQTIASIDARDLQKSLQNSLNSYMIARDSFDETKYENKDNALTDTIRRVLSTNQYNLNASVFDVELKNIALSNASLYSPIDGIVTKVPTAVAGTQVTAADSFEIVDPASLQFHGEVDEVDIGKVKVGQTVHIIMDAYPTNILNAKVESIALKATTSTKASGGTVFLVKASIPDEDILKYRLGMNGTMKIVTDKADNVLTIPYASTTQRDNKTYVQVKMIKNGKLSVQEKEIITGIENDDRIEVKSGLTLADEIVEVK